MARFLAEHPRIEKVYYPGLETHPYHDVARRTMRGFGGLVTFLVRDADWRQTAAVVDAVRIPRIAPSLGGVESLIEQPLVMSYYKCTPEERRRYGIPDNMIRLACGIENSEDLVADLAAGTRTATVQPRRDRAIGTDRSCYDQLAPSEQLTSMQFRTRAIHVGNEPDPTTGAVVRPIHLATTFVQPGAGEWGEFDYSRSGNPTRKAFETTLAASRMGRGRAGVCLGHGCHALRDDAAGAAAITSLAGTDIYGGTYRLLHKMHRSLRASTSRSRRVDRSCRRLKRPITPRTQAVVDRNARQSAAVDHRHRRAAPSGARDTGMLLGGRQHVRHAGADPAAGAGGRHRHALGHQVHRRP